MSQINKVKKSKKKVEPLLKVPHFYFSYVGGKSKELSYIFKYMDVNKYDKIIEPFCGSCAFTLSFFQNHFNNQVFHINDIDDNLYRLLSDIKINGSNNYFDFLQKNWINGKTTREEHNNIVILKDTNLLNWFYFRKIYKLRIGLYPLNANININNSNDKYTHLDKFFQNPNTIISNQDYRDIIEKYKDDEKAFIFLDPPYFLSDNNFYKQKGEKFGGTRLNKTEFIDPTEEFLYIRNALENYKCTILMIINECCLLKDYYKNYFKESYGKRYEMTKKVSRHMVITNIK
jgi:site-specific DNA-adenine methylase